MGTRSEKMSNLAVLLLCNGMTGAQLAESIADLKNASKSCGTHRQREFWWQAYGKIVTCCSGREGEQYGFVTYRSSGAGGGAAGEDEEEDTRGGEAISCPSPASKSKCWPVVSRSWERNSNLSKRKG